MLDTGLVSRVIKVGIEVAEAYGDGMFRWVDVVVNVSGGLMDDVVIIPAWGKICVEYSDRDPLDGGVDICKVMWDDDLDLEGAGVTKVQWYEEGKAARCVFGVVGMGRVGGPGWGG